MSGVSKRRLPSYFENLATMFLSVVPTFSEIKIDKLSAAAISTICRLDVASGLKNDECTRIWKETVASQSQVQSRPLLGTEENNEEIQLQIVSPPRFEVGTSRISLRSATTREFCAWSETQNISAEWNQDYWTHCAWHPTYWQGAQ
jgi:hypothetical protein